MNTIICEKIQAYLPGYVDHELEEPLVEEVERHLAKCASCQSQKELYLQDKKRIQKLKMLTIDPSFWDTYMEEIRFKLENEVMQKEQLRITLLTWATRAVLAATILLAIFIWGALKWKKVDPIPMRGVHTTKNSIHPPITRKKDIREATLMVPEFLQKGNPEILPSKIPLIEGRKLHFGNQNLKVKIVTSADLHKKGTQNENLEMDF